MDFPLLVGDNLIQASRTLHQNYPLKGHKWPLGCKSQKALFSLYFLLSLPLATVDCAFPKPFPAVPWCSFLMVFLLPLLGWLFGQFAHSSSPAYPLSVLGPHSSALCPLQNYRRGRSGTRSYKKAVAIAQMKFWLREVEVGIHSGGSERKTLGRLGEWLYMCQETGSRSTYCRDIWV